MPLAKNKRPLLAIGPALLVGLVWAATSFVPAPALARDDQAGLQVCALRWGMNHDLGYCGQVIGEDKEMRRVKLEQVFVSHFGFGWKNACSAWQHLGQLEPGETITVHKDCLDRKPGLLSNWRDATVLIQGVAGVALLLLGA